MLKNLLNLIKEFVTGKPFVEALKEFFRVILVAIIPVLIFQIENNAFDWGAIFVVGGIAGLRFIDKLLHETGKEADNDNLVKGLTRF